MPRDEHVDDGKDEEDDGEGLCSVSDLNIEDEFSQESPEEGEIEKEEAFHGKISGNVALETGSSEQVVLVDPIVEAETNKDEESTNGNEVSIEEGEPHHLDKLSITLAHVVVIVSHEVVCFVLGHIRMAMVLVSCVDMAQLKRMNGPNERN